jgi:deoxyribodipyrimidine photo-lyase
MNSPSRIVWHRGDLRVHDHPALRAALEGGSAVGLVVLDSRILGSTSARRRAHFCANVRALAAEYERRGGTLVVRQGIPERAVPAVAEALGAEAVHALRSYTPYGASRDERTERALRPCPVVWHGGLYVHEPGTLRSGGGGAYRVFAPFFKRWEGELAPEPLDAPARIESPPFPHGFDPGEAPELPSDVELPPPGEEAALAELERFLAGRVAAYDEARERLDGSGGSRLSPWITIGVLSPRTALARAAHLRGAGPASWRRELAWRDFLAALLLDHPSLPQQPLDPRWKRMRWSRSRTRLEAWQNGRTGIPAVDAAMRELSATGWISNRARMIAAQFLAKQLRVHWRHGERVFRELLLDGDVASNVGNWQWAAGVGVDNAPYFRVFDPVAQARRHDPDGAWLRRWVPECGGDPRPVEGAVVDLKQARAEYLAEAERV